MQRPIGYITVFLLACMACLLTACGNNAGGEGIVVPDADGAMVRLSFSVQTTEAPAAQASRALVTTPDDNNYFEPAATDQEKLHSLRVIIVRHTVDAAGDSVLIVEGNYKRNEFDTPLSYVSGSQMNPTDPLGFEVIGGEYKTIYLIGNEEATGLTDQLGYAVGAPYDGAIETLTFAPADNGTLLINNTGTTKQYVPMTEKFDVFVPEAQALPSVVQPDPADAGKNIRIHYINLGTLFVTRTAVKFSFNVSATNVDNLYLTSILVNGLAKQEYLLPHNTVYTPAKPSFHLYPNADAGQTTTVGRFITAYAIPPETQHGDYTFLSKEGVKLSPTPVALNPALYFCESMLNGPNPPLDGDPYNITVVLTQQGTNNTQILTAPLENLPILPRNTHVVVNIQFNGNDVHFQVDLVPYIGVYLDPVFGKNN